MCFFGNNYHNMAQRREKEEQLADDMGFGKKFVGKNTRMINEDGSFNIIKEGSVRSGTYEHLIYAKPISFVLEIVFFFVFINVVFAFFYFINGVENINIKPAGFVADFLNCFFFSIQTFTSVGYGFLNPQNIVANIIAAINAFLGLLGLALVTGIVFARFSRSRAHIDFSKNILIAPLNGEKTLQFRIVNKSTSTLINMECAVNLTWLEKVDDVYKRKFARLKLELEFVYLFPLNWTLVHKINETSPLYNKTVTALIEQNAEVLVMIKGYDDTYDQNIFKNYSYQATDLVENAVFNLMYESLADKTILRLDKLNDFKPA